MWRGRPPQLGQESGLARFRRTRQQVLGHRLYLGLLAGAGAGVLCGLPLLVRRLGGQRDRPVVVVLWLLAALSPVLVGLLGGVLGGRGAGTDADDAGVRRMPPVPDGFWPWPGIVDIRAQRRGARTIVALYLDSGLVLRLTAPYDGRLLGRDPEFEHKYFTLRNLWETYRRWDRPGRSVVR